MSISEYTDAWRKGTREAHLRHIQGKDPYLPVLSEIEPELNRLTRIDLGIRQIPLDQIEGTVLKGRTAAFSYSFLPLLDPDSEFAAKWSDLYTSVSQDGMNHAIKVLEYYNKYYIMEGNKRVSVMKQLDALTIEADVSRVLPKKEDTPRWRIYNEFLGFYRDTKVDYILFTHEGSYAHFLALAGHEAGVPWTDDELDDLHSCFYRFQQAYTSKENAGHTLTVSDAFLLYIEIFTYAEAIQKTPSEMAKDIQKIRSEYSVAAAGKPAVLISEPSDDKPGIIQSVLHRPPKRLRIAFLYNSSPDRSGWTYWHELGRKAIEETFGSQVETIAVPDIKMADAAEKIDSLIAEGYTTIFAASPVFLDACIRKSAAHPEARILNCSLLASYHNVRSYYLRIYEAKFLLGAIAGALADNDKIGYIADYPIYGVPASINAFASGAQMTNPRAKIYLEWSTLPDHNPEQALLDQDISIISSRDISAPLVESRTFGLYQVNDGKNTNLAMPVWNWSKLYQSIIKSILSGAWDEEGEQHADRAMNYYMGMSTDAIDLFCSARLPVRLHRLVKLLHERIRSGAFLPFVGPIMDQSGVLRVENDLVLNPQEIILMDYLMDNVVGSIPTVQQLNPAARSLVTLQGIRAATAAPDPASDNTQDSTKNIESKD